MALPPTPNHQPKPPVLFLLIETTNQILDFWKVWTPYSFWTPFSMINLEIQMFWELDEAVRRQKSVHQWETSWGVEFWKWRLKKVANLFKLHLVLFLLGSEMENRITFEFGLCSIFITCLFRTARSKALHVHHQWDLSPTGWRNRWHELPRI